MRTSLIAGCVLSLAVALGACHVEEHQAHTDSVVAPDLGYFPVTSRVTLGNNRMFLWRGDVTGDQARTVMQSGQHLDDLEAEMLRISSRSARGEDGSRRYSDEDAARVPVIDEETQMMIFAVMENTDLYSNQPEHVSFFLNADGSYGVTIYKWEYQNYSSAPGDLDDPAQRIRDVSYDPNGGTWRFKLYEPPQAFGVDADYFDFRISRTRLWHEVGGVLQPDPDGRAHEFYQGDILVYKNGVVIRRGVAKIMSSASE